MAGSRHIDVTGLINGNSPGAVSAVSRSVVGGNPLFVSGGVVLDGHVIVIRFSAQYASCHIDIARVINLNGNGRVVSGSAVALNPLFLSSRIVFDGRVIIIRKCCAETKSSYINIALLINGNSCRCVIAISKAVVAGDPCFLYGARWRGSTSAGIVCKVADQRMRTRFGKKRRENSGHEDYQAK